MYILLILKLFCAFQQALTNLLAIKPSRLFCD